MEKVFSLKEAETWFLRNSLDSVICVKNGVERVCKCFLDAEEFYLEGENV